MTPLAGGDVVAGRYRLMKRLGQGGMGSVWQAEHLVLRAPVAVKVIDPKLLSHATTADEARRRFLLEARAAAALRSPHVVQILDYGVDGETPFIVMEMLEGESLREHLARMKTLSPRDTARIVTQVVRALARAHEQDVVHRDLKPDNLFVTRNDDEMVVKVLDFGLAKMRAYASSAPKEAANFAPNVTDSTASGFTLTGTIVGTPAYMSPEQTLGSRIDFRSDLFCLALIVFECLTGRRAFDANETNRLVTQVCIEPMPVPSRVNTVPPGFDAWFARAAMRDPNKRFQSAREFAEALRGVLVPAGEEEGSLASTSSSTHRRAGPSHLMSAAILMGATAAVVAAGLFALSRAGSSKTTAAPPAAVSAPASQAVAAPPAAQPEPEAVATAAPTASASAAPSAAATSDARPPDRGKSRGPPGPSRRGAPPKKGDPRLGF